MALVKPLIKLGEDIEIKNTGIQNKGSTKDHKLILCLINISPLKINIFISYFNIIIQYLIILLC